MRAGAGAARRTTRAMVPLRVRGASMVTASPASASVSQQDSGRSPASKGMTVRAPWATGAPGVRSRRAWASGLLPTEDAALVLLFSLVASGQIKLRKIDSWQKIGAVLNQHTAVAA